MAQLTLKTTPNGIILEGNIPTNTTIELQDNTLIITNPANPQTAQHLQLPTTINSKEAIILQENNQLFIAAPTP